MRQMDTFYFESLFLIHVLCCAEEDQMCERFIPNKGSKSTKFRAHSHHCQHLGSVQANFSLVFESDRVWAHWHVEGKYSFAFAGLTKYQVTHKTS